MTLVRAGTSTLLLLYPQEIGRAFVTHTYQGNFNNMSTKSIAVHLPDGSVREVPAGTTPLDIANSISPRLAAASVVARLTPVGAGNEKSASEGQSESEATMYGTQDASAPRLVDLSTPLTADTRLELVKEADPEALKVVRHSAAHLVHHRRQRLRRHGANGCLLLFLL